MRGGLVEIAQYLILFCILFVLNLVVLVAALVIFGSLMGEVEFGSLIGLVWKGAVLALVVSAVQIIPFVGGWLALAVWVGGFVVLFEMDVSNCWVLALVVWGLSFGVRFFAFLALVSMLKGA
jgi:hypothetical protein